MFDRVNVRNSEFRFDVIEGFLSDFVDSVLVSVTRLELEIFLEEKFHLFRLKVQLDHPLENLACRVVLPVLDDLKVKQKKLKFFENQNLTIDVVG